MRKERRDFENRDCASHGAGVSRLPYHVSVSRRGASVGKRIAASRWSAVGGQACEPT